MPGFDLGWAGVVCRLRILGIRFTARRFIVAIVFACSLCSPWLVAPAMAGEKVSAISLARSVAGDGAYTPGASLDITVTLAETGSGTLTAMGLEETLPPGWAFDGCVGGTQPAIAPMSGAVGLLDFAWFPIPAFPVILTYRVNVPEEQVGSKEIVGQVIWRELGVGEQRTPEVSTVIPPISSPRTFYVDRGQATSGDGSSESPFLTLQEAMDATAPARGDVVRVRPGTYEGGIALKAYVEMLSEQGPYRTRISLSSGGGAAVLLAQGCVIRGFMVEAAGGVALRVSAGAQAEATNLVLLNSDVGLAAETGSSVVFVNNTIYGNATYGVRAESDAQFEVLKNNLFVQNGTAVIGGAAAIVHGGYNEFFGSTSGYDFEGAVPAVSDFVADPLFVQAEFMNFRLQSSSPARNAGDPDSAFNDRNGSRNDIGSSGGPYGVDGEEGSAFVWGDLATGDGVEPAVTCNGSVGGQDASVILRWYAGLADSLMSCPDGAQYTAPAFPPGGDVNGDGRLGGQDASLVLRYYAGLISCFPADMGCSTK